MRVAVQLQNMFVCTLSTSSDYLAGGGLGREVGAMSNTFCHQIIAAGLKACNRRTYRGEKPPRVAQSKRERGETCAGEKGNKKEHGESG